MTSTSFLQGLKRTTYGLLIGSLILYAVNGKAQTPTQASPSPTTPDTIYRFDFGSGKTQAGFQQVTAQTLYTAERGYGFENGATLEEMTRKKGDDLTNDFITSSSLFKFSIKLPEGNYKVTVTLGDSEGESCTTVKAEERRLMLERVTTAKKEVVKKTFMVNIRTPKLSPGNEIKLDVREWDPDTDLPVTATWDDKLTLRFSDSLPCVCAVEIEPVSKAITVFLIGDSTVTDQVTEPYGTWGQHLTRWFKVPVVIANHAESGQTAKGFRFQRRWDKVMDLMQPGDYVFIQFGHNDLNQKGHDAMWATDDNAGNWVNTYADALTDYKWFLAAYAVEVKRRGGIPVIVSPMTKLNKQSGTINATGLKEYPQGAKEAAEMAECAFIDLHAMSIQMASGLGTTQSPLAYADGLHSNTYGGYLFSRCIVEGIKTAKLDLVQYLSDDCGSFNPAQPIPLPADFTIPADPMVQVPVPPGMRMMFSAPQR